MKKYKLFGIPNCDTVKKMRHLLDLHKVNYEFIDFKKYKPSKNDFLRWQKAFGSDPVNTKGPTYRKIKDQFENASLEQKIQILQENTSAIKRPILETETEKVLSFGFDEKIVNQL